MTPCRRGLFGLMPVLLFVLGNRTLIAETFQFRTPQVTIYELVTNAAPTNVAPALIAPQTEWIATRRQGTTNGLVELGRRLVLQLQNTNALPELIAGHSLEVLRVVGGNIFILQASDAWTAAWEAQRLADVPGVRASCPIMRRQADLDGPYAPAPTDTSFPFQWPLEHRMANGASAGVDLNVRAAWPYSTGQGVTVAVADTGVELNHPELVQNIVSAENYNFADQGTNAMPINRGSGGAHGTEVAGLIAAQMNNGRMVGVAPDAHLASWVVFDTNSLLAADDLLMDVYQYASNTVSVQNYSWGNVGLAQQGPSLLEQVGLSNAISAGRFGRGAIMVRAGGNDRTSYGNADDDGYPNDPRVITVAAVRLDGRVASYSEPGACVLVAAPSGDISSGFNGVMTTDLLGTDGYNQLSYCPPQSPDCPNKSYSDYVFDALGFSGTSAAAPHVAGVAALMLGANPNLGYRDVQQILILASRHFDLADPDLTTNGAGFVVSHNDGFGVPDAGAAVKLAKNWTNRLPQTNLTFTATNISAIPDDGLRVLITGSNIPTNLTSIRCLPSVGPQADTPTLTVPLVDFGYGTNLTGFDLTNRAALIQRYGGASAPTIQLAAQGGARFAIIYNFATNTSGSGPAGGDELAILGNTDFVPIPAVFIGHTDGEALKALFQTNASARAQIHLQSTNYVFAVTNTLTCEHVGLRVQTDHPLRGNLRITLVSPSGTRSVLQRLNLDSSPGPVDWTYYTTHCFFESSAGTWTADFSDEGAGNTGSVLSVSLMISGVPIVDQDHDGLDDAWENLHFPGHQLTDQGPKDDPDFDGYSNAREQLMGTDPTVPNDPLQLVLSKWSSTLSRLSWPGNSAYNYDLFEGESPAALVFRTNVPGHFPETEWFVPYTAVSNRFFQNRAIAAP